MSRHVDELWAPSPCLLGWAVQGCEVAGPSLARFLAYKGSITISSELTVNSIGQTAPQAAQNQHQPDTAHGTNTSLGSLGWAPSTSEIDTVARPMAWEHMLEWAAAQPEAEADKV